MKTSYSNPRVGAFAFPCKERKNGLFEDASLVDEDGPVFAVADGYTQLVYTEEEERTKMSKAREAAELFCKTVVENLGRQRGHEPEYQAMWNANEEIRELNRRYGISNPDFWTSDYACCYGAVGFLSDDRLRFHYAYISDCFVAVLDKDTKWKLPVRDDLDPVHDFWQDIQGEANKEFVTRALIRNKPGPVDGRGRELSYGTLTGEMAAMSFVRHGTIEVGNGDIILLGTDGAMPYLEEKGFLDLLQGPDEKVADFMENGDIIGRKFGKERTLVVARMLA